MGSSQSDGCGRGGLVVALQATSFVAKGDLRSSVRPSGPEVV